MSDSAYWACTMGCGFYPRDFAPDDCPRCGHPLILAEPMADERNRTPDRTPPGGIWLNRAAE